MDGTYLAAALTKTDTGTSFYAPMEKKRYVRVNILVLETFLGKPPNKDDTAAHENGVRQDNRLINLRWATQKSNIADKVRHGTSPVGERNSNAKFTEAQVILIRSRRQKGERATDLAKEFKVTTGAICAICLGYNWKHLPLAG